MAIDIRAIVNCSLGTLISGSISDDYIQGSGLVKTKGSVEISGTITPAIGTVVTFNYVKGGVTRSIPRKLRVMSSFADPFRRTTQVELGCKLTYLSDLKDPVDWDAFDDPANAAYDADDARIVTLPIYASNVMSKCLAELGITASSSPLTNKFSIAEFDFGAGYVPVLNDLLVSESYCGYLDTNEVLQIFALDQDAGTGPVFTASDIADLGPIGVGQLPGEAVTVSYSTLKLKNPDDDADGTDRLNWEEDETIGLPTTVRVENPFFDSNPFPFPVPQYFEYIYIPRSKTITVYDTLDRVTTRTTTEYTILAAVAPGYVQHIAGIEPQRGPAVGSIVYTIISVEQFNYAVNAEGTNPKNPPENYEEVTKQTSTIYEPLIKLNASTEVYDIAGELNIEFTYGFDNTSKFIAERTTTTYVYGVGLSGEKIAKTLTTKELCNAYTQEGQQELATFFQNVDATPGEFEGDSTRALVEAKYLKTLGTEIQINTGREIGLQQRPSTADLTNAKYNNGGDPNNGWRTESKAELELAVGSAAAQRRIEFSLPYAPDDIFSGPTGGPFTAVASDAPAKANRYGRVQNRLLLGNRNGINLQIAPDKLPFAPYSPLYVQASNLTAQYRTNGTSWAFDSNGIVASVDALFWTAVGGTGTFWFPVAPSVTTLPTAPAVVNTAPTQVIGTIATVGATPQTALNAAFPTATSGNGVQDQATGNFWVYSGTIWNNVGTAPGPTTTPTTVVLPYNETAIYEGRLRLGNVVTKFEYALQLLTVIPPLRVRTNLRLTVAVIAPNTSVALAGLSTEETGSLSIPVDISSTSITGLAPFNVGEPDTIYVDEFIAVTISGQAVTVPNADPLVFNFDGVDGSTSISSSSGNLVTATLYGTAALDTSNKKFGTASLYLDGPPNDPAGDWITYDLPQAFGLGNFCVEFWIYTPASSQGAIYASSWAISDFCSLDVDYDTGGGYVFYLYDEILEIDGSILMSITYGQWQHVACYRNNGIFYLAVNGVVTLSPTTMEIDITQTLNVIGEWTTVDGSYAVPATWIDEIRTTFGSSVYGTTNFTAPTGPF